MKYLILILVGLVIIFLSGCGGPPAIYYSTIDCDCSGGYHCISGFNKSVDYCVRDYDGFLGTPSGDIDFENDMVKCTENITIIKNNTYDCWEMRQIIDLGLNIPQKEVRINNNCNYPQYSTENVNVVEWRQIYLEECFNDETN